MNFNLHFGELHSDDSINDKNNLFENYIPKCYKVKRILISFNCFSEYICSAIKCTLEIIADDYFVTLNGAVYDAIETAYIVLRKMGYLRVSCQPSTIILPAFVCLPVCSFCSCVCVCKRTTRNTQSRKYE